MSTSGKQVFIFCLALIVFCTTVAAQQYDTGSFAVRRTTPEVLGEQAAATYSEIIPVDEELRWQVYVPDTYDPANPPGLFVFSAEDGWGGMPDQYRQLFARRNLIWIGANSNERRRDETRNLVQVFMAQQLIERNYRLDLGRLYLGSSGAGATTVVNALFQINTFTGAVYLQGAAYWGGGKPDSFDQVKGKPQVFIIGKGDDAREQVQDAFESYRKDGIENVELMSSPGRIRGWPDVELFEQALSYLDVHQESIHSRVIVAAVPAAAP